MAQARKFHLSGETGTEANDHSHKNEHGNIEMNGVLTDGNYQLQVVPINSGGGSGGATRLPYSYEFLSQWRPKPRWRRGQQ